MTRYSDNPTARVEVHVAAPPEAVWPLVSDISVPSRFSTELAGAEWADGFGGPSVGARFTGRSHHDAIGDWQSACVVVTCEAGQAFGWVVGDPEYPSARWGFELEAAGGGTRLSQWATLGPAPSGLTPAITAMPDKEERIVARRLAEHEANMRRCVEGIKALAEGGPAMTDGPVAAPAMRLAVAASAASAESAEFVVEAERLGADAAWSAELWGYDALTQLGYLAARTSRIGLGTSIVQLGARTPAMLAMSAMSLQQLSGGRFRLGIGASGPQVMEGWHGVRFRRPVQATRETIEIIAMISRGDRLEYHGQVYDLPLPDSQGRAIRSMAAPVRVPVYVAAIGPANLALTGELADGWLGNTFIPESAEVFLGPLRAGAQRAGRTLADLDLQVPVAVEFTEDVDEAVARHSAGYAFTIGAMGSATTNFYNDAFARQGFGEQVAEVQRLWRDGRRDEAARLVPREIGEKTNLLGTPAMIADRIRRHRAAGVSTLSLKLDGPLRARLDTLAQMIDLVGEINREQPA